MTQPRKKVMVILSNNFENTLKKEMNNKECNIVLQFLLQHLKNDKLSHHAINAAAIKFMFIIVQYPICGNRQ